MRYEGRNNDGGPKQKAKSFLLLTRRRIQMNSSYGIVRSLAIEKDCSPLFESRAVENNQNSASLALKSICII